MDWRMPGMDGLQASRHIKSDETLTPSARHRAGHRVRTRRSPRGSRAAAARRLPRQAGHQVDDRGHAGERLRRRRRGETRSAAEGEQATRLRGARILLAEDNEINQQIAVELLEGAGATVKVANNGREAVEILSSGPQPPPFDVVLMDLQMPEMDGYQATAKLRSDARFATLPIIAMTAHATIEERQRCLAAGMNDHISKPIDPDNLFETVGAILQAAGDRRARRCEPSAAARAPTRGRPTTCRRLPASTRRTAWPASAAIASSI